MFPIYAPVAAAHHQQEMRDGRRHKDGDLDRPGEEVAQGGDRRPPLLLPHHARLVSEEAPEGTNNILQNILLPKYLKIKLKLPAEPHFLKLNSPP